MHNKIKNKNAGMTYVELIVVLTIFAIISSISLFNYKSFQARIDIKNLTNEIAIRIVQAQKEALSGRQAPAGKYPSPPPPASWRPAYGVYFNLGNGSVGNKKFFAFVDLNQDGQFDNGYGCPVGGECLGSSINLSNATITETRICHTEDCTSYNDIGFDLHITFTRPNTAASISSTPSVGDGDYVRIRIQSTASAEAFSYIRIYPLGRIEVTG